MILLFFGGAGGVAAALPVKAHKIRRVLPNGTAFYGTEEEYRALLAILRQRETKESTAAPAEKPRPAPEAKAPALAPSLMELPVWPGPLELSPIELPDGRMIDWARVAEAKRAREQENALVALMLAS